MKYKISNYILNVWHRLRSLLFLILILYITSVPIVKIVFHALDVRYELCEIYEENDTKGKEMIVYKVEDEDRKYYLVQHLSFFNNCKCPTDFNPDVTLPPPKAA